MKKAILVVSFGTTHKDTMEKNIEVLEKDIASQFPDRHFARAFTSGMIMRILEQRDGVKIDNVKEAMEKLLNAGYEDVFVQATHIMNGEEYEKMLDQLKPFEDKMEISCGKALLTSSEDYDKVVEALCNEGFSSYLEDKDAAIVLMGHGTGHFADAAYAALDYRFKAAGCRNVFVGTVEGYPDLDTVMQKVAELSPKRVLLMPFMIVAGDHAKNDMAGEDDDSWRALFTKKGYQVECRLKGLGEIEAIRNIYVEHVKELNEK